MPERACIYVLAGTNGAGKSSVLGEMAIAAGADFFNPDEATRRILEANPGALAAQANEAAWRASRQVELRHASGNDGRAFPPRTRVA